MKKNKTSKRKTTDTRIPTVEQRIETLSSEIMRLERERIYQIMLLRDLYKDRNIKILKDALKKFPHPPLVSRES